VPIYEYRCTNCGFEKEYLQRVSDPRVTECPSCGQSTMVKQVTAAGFQLKGTGWYVTDFKNKSTGKPAAADKKAGVDGEGAKTDSKTESKSDSKTESSAEQKSEKQADTKTPATAAKADAASSASASKPAASSKPAAET
jgi:putative FmdB family regulatory protein